eukprot:scaffold124080_cov28-Cyclotella_meneghiniana.AAC.1
MERRTERSKWKIEGFLNYAGGLDDQSQPWRIHWPLFLHPLLMADGRRSRNIVIDSSWLFNYGGGMNE